MGDTEGGERGPARAPQQRCSSAAAPLFRTDSMPGATPGDGTRAFGMEPATPRREQQTAARHRRNS